MTSSTDNVGRRYDIMMRRRTVLLWTHVVLGLLSGFVLMTQEDFRHFPYWSRVGIAVLVRHLLASWPYVVSGVACYRRNGITLLGLLLFEAILLVGTGLGALVYVGAVDLGLEGLSILFVPLGQACIFTAAAMFLMPSTLESA